MRVPAGRLMNARRVGEPTQWDRPPVPITTARPPGPSRIDSPIACPSSRLRRSEGRGGTLQFWATGTIGTSRRGVSNESGMTNEWSIATCSEKASSTPRAMHPSRTAWARP